MGKTARQSNHWRNISNRAVLIAITHGQVHQKDLFPEHIRIQAVRSIAESAKRNSDAIEELNAITAFSRPEACNLPQTSQFFAALRRVHLAKALKRAKLAEAVKEN